MQIVEQKQVQVPPWQCAMLELSAERDQWHQWVLAMWRQGYAAGRAEGYREGYDRAVADWKVTAAGLGHLLGGPTYAELDKRRYPPGGRQSWVTPRNGDQAVSR